MIDFINELRWRGFIHQSTDEGALRRHLAEGLAEHKPCLAYAGFDPTADSLTVGHLVPLMVLKHWQRAGHLPVAVAGGGTGLIGDPSGKTSERTLLSEEQVRANVASISRAFARVLDLGIDENGRPRGAVVNNLDWLGGLGFLEVLRGVGKHFSVNVMIQKDSVRERLHNRDQGISYTEFSYMILQAYDWLALYRDWRRLGLPGPVTVQLGGSDQWGNIVAGSDLIRRAGGESGGGETHALTVPLVTKADGTKFGKSEAGAVWLNAERTSPYAFYQFWLNAADADVGKYLRWFTLLDRGAIEGLEAEQAGDPGKRAAQRALAREVTRLIHGEEELAKAEGAAAALFGKAKGGGGEVDDGGPFVLPEEVAQSAPATRHALSLLTGVGMALVDLLPLTSLAKSKTEARTLLAQNSISVNGRGVAADARVSEGTLLEGGVIALRRGKKTWHVTRWG